MEQVVTDAKDSQPEVQVALNIAQLRAKLSQAASVPGALGAAAFATPLVPAQSGIEFSTVAQAILEAGQNSSSQDVALKMAALVAEKAKNVGVEVVDRNGKLGMALCAGVMGVFVVTTVGCLAYGFSQEKKAEYLESLIKSYTNIVTAMLACSQHLGNIKAT